MTFVSYQDFFPFYVAAHSRRATRWLHFTGTLLGLGVGALLVATGHGYLVWLTLVIGYAFAWVAHFGIEANKPATFGHPIWSFRGDWHMIALMATGQDAKLSATAHAWKQAHAVATST